MPDSKNRPVGARMVEFVGGPFDGQVLPMRGDGYACVLRSSTDVNGTTIRWHWYRFDERGRYEFVMSDAGGWPEGFEAEGG